MPAGSSQDDTSLIAFSEIDCWIFDLDNTLYPRHVDLFKQMNLKMNDYVARLLGLSDDAASALRQSYYKDHGTTMRGLMVEHGIEPDAFLEFVHDIDHSVVPPDPELARAVCALPGQRFIFTNGTRKHANKVAERLGITEYFEEIFDIVWADFDPKPNRAPYEKLLDQTGVDPKRCAMFEDLARNLEVPAELGMRTILIVPPKTREVFHDEWGAEGEEAPHVQHVTANLGGFLTRVLSAIGRDLDQTV